MLTDLSFLRGKYYKSSIMEKKTCIRNDIILVSPAPLLLMLDER